MPIQGTRFKCDNCFDFDFCESCYTTYAIQKRELKTVYSTAHKSYHSFTRLYLAANSSNPKDSNALSEPNGRYEESKGEEIKARGEGVSRRGRKRG